MAISLLQEIGYLEGRLTKDLVKSALEVLKPHEGQQIDDGFLDKLTEELRIALCKTIGGWDWVCGHQPHTLWFSPRTGERTRPRIEGKRLVDVLTSDVVAELLHAAAKALKDSVSDRKGVLVDAKETADAVGLQAVLSTGNQVCKYHYGGCYWYNTRTGQWGGPCTGCLGPI